jgi:hypothetical protein
MNLWTDSSGKIACGLGFRVGPSLWILFAAVITPFLKQC